MGGGGVAGLPDAGFGAAVRAARGLMERGCAALAKLGPPCLASYSSESIGPGASAPQRLRNLTYKDSISWYNYLVRANLSGFPADQLVGKVRVDLARVEERGMVRKPIALLLHELQLGAAPLQRAPVIAPGEQSIGPEQRESREVRDHQQGDRSRRG